MEKPEIAFYQVIEKENLTGNERVVGTFKAKKSARKFMKKHFDYGKKAWHLYVKPIKSILAQS